MTTRRKDWYLYIDESGARWRIQTTAAIADIGGLVKANPDALSPLPPHIKPRYIWITEVPRPETRIRKSVKVVIQNDRLKQIWGTKEFFDYEGKTMSPRSYYGESWHA
jgi:hypothetical protein